MVKRKTREEKIIARLRKELTEVKKDLKQSKKKKEKKTSSPHFLTSTPYLKKDLTKAVILSILAMSIELVIYLLYS